MMRGWRDGQEEPQTPSLFDGSTQDKRDQLRQEAARPTGDGSGMPYGSDAREWMRKRKEQAMKTTTESKKSWEATDGTWLLDIDYERRELFVPEKFIDAAHAAEFAAAVAEASKELEGAGI